MYTFDKIPSLSCICTLWMAPNENLQIQKSFMKSITSIWNVLNWWRIRNITLEEKLVIFKTLALSTIVYLPLITSFSKQFIEEMQKNKNKNKHVYLEQLGSQNQTWNSV